MRVLISWVGFSDLKAAKKNFPSHDLGPVLRLARRESFDAIHLLNDIQPDEEPKDAASPEQYRIKLAGQIRLDSDKITLHSAKERLQNQYGPTYEFTREKLHEIQRALPVDARVGMLLSPGTSAAQLAMILASRIFTEGSCELFNTWVDKQGDGVERVELPFSLTVDLASPQLLRMWSREITTAPLGKVFDSILGESTAIACARQMANRVANYRDIPVMIHGETGTGKELFAQAIHEARYAQSGTDQPRKEPAPFVAINCAAIPETLLESELFGHAKGAFTDAKQARAGKIEAAKGGTLFLDEIGDMPLALQAKLLRFLDNGTYSPVGSDQTKKAEVSVITATHRDLKQRVDAGHFREDLYYRLVVFEVTLPPLRERGRDAAMLAERFLQEFNRQHGTAKAFSLEALTAILARPWRGNVRELRNAVQRLAVLVAGDSIGAEDVQSCLGSTSERAVVSLAELSPGEFVSELTAVLEELLERFRDEARLPVLEEKDAESTDDLHEAILDPLIFGRAMHLAPSKNQAGRMFQKGPIDTGKKHHLRRIAQYEKWKSWIDETWVSRRRRTES